MARYSSRGRPGRSEDGRDVVWQAWQGPTGRAWTRRAVAGLTRHGAVWMGMDVECRQGRRDVAETGLVRMAGETWLAPAWLARC